MRVTFGRLVIAAGISGILSFAFLATSLGTEYWYLIATIPINGTEDINVHHGLWTVNDGGTLSNSLSDQLCLIEEKRMGCDRV